MNTTKYKYALYAIVLVILAVIAIQVYWNINNYQNNKQHLINDVQVSLDNAVDTYYTGLAERNTLGFSYDGERDLDFLDHLRFDSIGKQIDSHRTTFGNLDSIKLSTGKNVKVFRGTKADSFIGFVTHEKSSGIELSKKKYDEEGNEVGSTTLTFKDLDSLPTKDASRFLGLEKLRNKSLDSTKNDSINVSQLRFLTSKIVISISTDSIPLKDLDTIIDQELGRKKIDIDYGLKYMAKDSSLTFLNNDIVDKSNLSTESKSSFLPVNTQLEIYFKNTTKEILYRSLGGIIISVLLVLSVITILFYLLKIINDQKQLAEIKNDLISNITHEFKTPIATVGVALESMKEFNALDDKVKAKQYINMSETQLNKLNVMVEKLLETASLDTDNLSLNFEPLNVNDLVESVIANHTLQSENKSIKLNADVRNMSVEADAFHLENAISNLVDNALKYGGNTIDLNLKQTSSNLILEVKDDGNELSKSEAQQIFNKFYRVPKGNTHDVKGFGIGLYYTKKIIEKHGGSIKLDVNSDGTNFIISLPNAR